MTQGPYLLAADPKSIKEFRIRLIGRHSVIIINLRARILEPLKFRPFRTAVSLLLHQEQQTDGEKHQNRKQQFPEIYFPFISILIFLKRFPQKSQTKTGQYHKEHI